MKLRKRRISLKSWSRRLTGLLVLGGFCVLLLPLPSIPLQDESDQKDQSQPFPCRNRPCGCQTADQCWKKCCCFTNTQKLAWAKANGVTPPAFVMTAALKEENAETKAGNPLSQAISAESSLSVRIDGQSSSDLNAQKSHPRCPHCRPVSKGAPDNAKMSAVSTKPATAVDRSLVATETCGRKLPAVKASDSLKSTAKSANQRKGARRKTATRWVLSVQAATCHGQGNGVFAFTAIVIPEPPAIFTADCQVPETCSVFSERLHCEQPDPPTPPPRIV